MKDECLLCGAPLEYLAEETPMECALCHRTVSSRARCVNGHFVCDECHTAGLEAVPAVCLASQETDPILILERLMRMPFCHMHGPEHHVMVGSAILTAFRNAGGEVDLPAALREMAKRGKAVPGGACGFWGACGAGVSAGMTVSIITGSTPLAGEAWGLSNRMTSAALGAIGAVGGPRCCKRDSYLSILAAVEFIREHLGVALTVHTPVCTRSAQNNQCLGARCPFHAK